jgi:HD superfamily phosphohydrolase
MTENFINIRDALYGGIRVSAAETACLEHPFMQRLRRVKQLGFAEYVYPARLTPVICTASAQWK